MKKNSKFSFQNFWICGLFLIFMLGQALGGDAILLNVANDVEVSTKSGTTKAQMGQSLENGMRVISRGGTATILFADGRTLKLPKDQTLNIESPASVKSASTLSRLMGSMSELLSTSGETHVKGMVRGTDDQGIQLLKPCNTAIRSIEQLEFQWVRARGMEKCSIQIKSRDPSFKYSFSVDAESGSARLPKNAPVLTAGKRYYWKLTGARDAAAEPIESELQWFTILEETKAAGLKKDLELIESLNQLEPKDRNYLAGVVLGSYELFSEAIELIKKHPDDPGIKNLLQGLARRQLSE